jgi:hypothetical protein
MRVTIARTSTGSTCATIRRDDGVVLELPGYDRKYRVPHDLAHAATEHALIHHGAEHHTDPLPPAKHRGPVPPARPPRSRLTRLIAPSPGTGAVMLIR